MNFSNDQIKSIMAELGGFKPAARYLREQGYTTSATTLRRRFPRQDQPAEYTVDAVEPEVNINDLIERRRTTFHQKNKMEKTSGVRIVKMRSNAPIGIGMVGDPHIDDDGTDIDLLLEHADIFDGRNPGLHAVLLGDIWNNWVGRLARLWAEQSTSAVEARALVEMYLRRIKWLAVIFGNHDAWSGHSDILPYILKDMTKIEAYFGQKIEIQFPNGRSVRMDVRHKWAGRSTVVQQFGIIKGAQADGQSDIYVGGDYHIAGYSNGCHAGTQRMFHAIQVASYKVHDRYAKELGLPSRNAYVCPVAVINPGASTPAGLIKMEFDPHEGAEHVKWLRNGS